MSLSKFTSAAVLLALAPTAMAMGQATVVNNCGSPVFYAPVGQSDHAEMQQMQGSYSQGWGSQGNGMSIKLSPEANGQVTQFEFTWADGKINYDMSNIDGNPFASGGMALVPSMQNDPNNPSCVPIMCAAGEASCDAAYNQPNDVRTHVCSEESNLVLTLCPGGGSIGTSSGSDSSTPSAPAASATESAYSSPSETAAAPAESSASYGWNQPPAKREFHGHQRVHSRAFIV